MKSRFKSKSHSSSNPKKSLLLAGIFFLLVILACEPSAETPEHLPGTPTPHVIEPITRFLNQSNKQECIQNIIPGETTQEDLDKLLGTPIFSEIDEGIETRFYFSSNEKRYHSIKLDNGIVVMVSVVFENDANMIPLSSILNEYGAPEATTFSLLTEGSYFYLYPADGQSFIVSSDSDTVFVRHCFTPMSLDAYMNTWGANLPKEDPFAD